jgi:hypothetical protein
MKIKYNYTLYNKSNPYGVEKTATANGEPCKKPTYLCGCDTGCIFIKTKSEKIHVIEIDKIIEINGRAFSPCCFNCASYYSEYGFDLCKKNDETMEEPNNEKCNEYIIELD